ncbi:hypothetical protein FHS61_001439 [Altererythrobacter atlanticus]|uniref:Uncharacterized protein n=1 Tax=Croceibacterium atlanticum TaxID=1267766 RepID=A0A0F7KZ55_9SPHN|nr:hypothetical protein [Croceibacterium atlanticum]AKH44120.1 hypothetical protein WYH_03101 [Croceibacterium atlanticum]MBB5732430.1 hypothetical protein [Croceibacterium atlanticum]
MLAAALALTVASLSQPSVQAASPETFAAYRKRCHPFAHKVPGCGKNREAARNKGKQATVLCHPDPTKSRSCNARARAGGKTLFAARKGDDTVVKE